MTSTIGFPHAPAAGFDAPFEMLTACHERVARMLRLLERLAGHLPLHGADDQARQAARDVLRYFDIAGPAHHEDEERHVLPWLAAHGEAALAQRLHDDHAAMAAGWQAVRADLLGVADGRWPAGASAPPRWAAFAQCYVEHIALEESRAYPPAQAAADAATQAAMGREMAGRRGAAVDGEQAPPPGRP
jgi:hemerythrin-like domain-containing protein